MKTGTLLLKKVFFHAMAVAMLGGFVACGNDDDSIDTDTGTDGDTDMDSDTDPDTETETETETNGIKDMCAEYPQSDDNFNEGSVISNYTLWDVNDNEFQICELAKDYDLLLLLLTRTT